jgi:hypothetical protein
MAARKKAKKRPKPGEPPPVTVSYQAWVGPGAGDGAAG